MTALDSPLASAGDISVDVAELLASLRQRGQLADLLRQALAEKVAVAAARDAGLTVPDAELQAAADDFRRRNGMHDAGGTHAWLAERGMGVPDLEAALERDLLIAKFQDHLFAHQGVARFEADRT